MFRLQPARTDLRQHDNRLVCLYLLFWYAVSTCSIRSLPRPYYRVCPADNTIAVRRLSPRGSRDLLRSATPCTTAIGPILSKRKNARAVCPAATSVTLSKCQRLGPKSKGGTRRYRYTRGHRSRRRAWTRSIFPSNPERRDRHNGPGQRSRSEEMDGMNRQVATPLIGGVISRGPERAWSSHCISSSRIPNRSPGCEIERERERLCY